MQGARARFITDEANMPDGRQRVQFSQWAGHLMGYVEEVEPHIQDLEPITSLGILFSETTRDHLRAQQRNQSSFIGLDFLPSLLGCTEALTRTQYPVDFLPSADLQAGSLSHFELIVLPETEALSDEDCQVLHNYVQTGGKIIATYKPGWFDDKLAARSDFGLASTLGVSYVEEVTKYAGKDGPGIYLQTNGHPLSSFLGSGEVGIVGKGVLPRSSCSPTCGCRARRKASSITGRLTWCQMWTNISFTVGLPLPPGNEHIPMAASVNKCGEGTAVYIGVPVFPPLYPDLYWIADWVCGLVTRLVPNHPSRFKVSRPSTQRSSVRDQTNSSSNSSTALCGPGVEVPHPCAT